MIFRRGGLRRGSWMNWGDEVGGGGWATASTGESRGGKIAMLAVVWH